VRFEVFELFPLGRFISIERVLTARGVSEQFVEEIPAASSAMSTEARLTSFDRSRMRSLFSTSTTL
jgi:hypothetical protein